MSDEECVGMPEGGIPVISWPLAVSGPSQTIYFCVPAGLGTVSVVMSMDNTGIVTMSPTSFLATAGTPYALSVTPVSTGTVTLTGRYTGGSAASSIIVS